MSFNMRRFIVAVSFVISMMFLANYAFEFQIFAGYDKELMLVSFVVAFLILRYIAPTIQELEEYRDRKRKLRK